MTPSPLPVRVRRITFAVIVLCGLVGSEAAQHVGQVFDLESFAKLEPPIADFWAQNAVAAVAAKAKHDAQLKGLESMRGSRAVILLALTLTCSLTFVAALRLLRPAGSPREDARRLLAGTAIASAVLRTMDGAQMTAIAARGGAAWDKVMKGSDIPGGYPEGMEQSILSAGSIAVTVVVAGAFVGIATYFRSSVMRELVAQADRSEQA